jgi:lysozyme family protein
MNRNDPLFKKYITHVLKWEGLTSDDPNDPASAYALFPGAVHTVKGVTWKTFYSYAAGLGINPVTYERFLQLSDQDVGKFVYLFTEQAKTSELPTLLALSITEAAWGSGPNRAVKHLQDALNAMGADLQVDGILGPLTMAAALKAPGSRLYQEYWRERKEYLEYLISHGYSMYANGWRNRVADFLRQFPYKNNSIYALLIIAALAFRN